MLILLHSFLIVFIMAVFNSGLFYSQVDVFLTAQSGDSGSPAESAPVVAAESSNQLCGLMQELVSTQDRQAVLLEQLVALMSHGVRTRTFELGMWKLSNPELAEYCKKAAKKLERVHNDMLSTLTGEIESNAESFFDNEYRLSEFIDKYGPRFFQLDAMLRMLQQLGNAPDIKLQNNEAVK